MYLSNEVTAKQEKLKKQPIQEMKSLQTNITMLVICPRAAFNVLDQDALILRLCCR